MKMKFGVTPLLFACVMGANGTANADVIRDDRYLGVLQQNVQAKPKEASSYRPRKHARHSRKLRTREVAAHHEQRVSRRPVAAAADSGEARSSLGALIAAKAATHGIPSALARAVVRVESNYNPKVTGGAGEVGLMQIKYQTARGLGYSGTRAALYDPATNLEWGMRYLAGAHRLAGGDLCGTLAKYQGGHATRGTRTTHNYCGRVRTAMNTRGA